VPLPTDPSQHAKLAEYISQICSSHVTTAGLVVT